MSTISKETLKIKSDYISVNFREVVASFSKFIQIYESHCLWSIIMLDCSVAVILPIKDCCSVSLKLRASKTNTNKPVTNAETKLF